MPIALILALVLLCGCQSKPSEPSMQAPPVPTQAESQPTSVQQAFVDNVQRGHTTMDKAKAAVEAHNAGVAARQQQMENTNP